MKTRKAKAAAKGKSFLSKKKLRGNLPLDVSDSGSDIDNESLFHDEIDDFHKNEEDQLSTDDELIQHKEESSGEEEVLPISGDESDGDEEEGDDDADGNDDERDLPNREAWGKKKSVYYGADFVDEDRGRTYREKDEEAAKAEEDEAFAIQKSVFSIADRLEANRFLEESSEEEEEKENDSEAATKYEKLKYLKKTSSDMLNFFGDFKASMQEIHDKLVPLLNLALNGNLPLEDWMTYIKLKYHLLLHYSLNLSFYLMLKSSNTKMEHHPVLERITTFKKLLDQVKVIDEATKDDIENILEKAKQNEEIVFYKSKLQDLSEDRLLQSVTESSMAESPKDKAESPNIKTRTSKRKQIDTEAEKEIFSFIQEVKEEVKRRKTEKSNKAQLPSDESVGEVAENAVEQEIDPSDEKRTITYQIAKNKGLVPHRKKEYRNPRVRNKEKYRKAKIRRKGQVRDVVKEIKRYEGEPTGISTHVVKSRKLK